MRRGLVMMVMGAMVMPGLVVAESAVSRSESVVVAREGQVRIVNTVSAGTASGGLVQQMQQQREEIRSQYQQRLSEIKDEQKRKLVERIRVRMCEINQNRTSLMNKQLDRMLQILVRVEEKAVQLKDSGKDVAAVMTAVEIAKGKIQVARGSVTVQADLECDIELSGSIVNLGNEVRRSISGLEIELKEVNEKIREAKRTVSEAVVALAHAMGNPLPTGVKED